MRGNPKSRLDNIIVQEMQDELLIYDLKTNRAFSLNETCAMVWQECDGEKTITEISAILSKNSKGLINEEVVWLAVDEFRRQNLLADVSAIPTNFSGLNRREVIRKIGYASLVTLPVITSLVAPTAANASSGVCVNLGGQPAGTPFLSVFPGNSCSPDPCASACALSVGYCCSNSTSTTGCTTDGTNINCNCVCN